MTDEDLWALYLEHGCSAQAVANTLGMAGSTIRTRITKIKRNLAIVKPDSVSDHLSDILEKSSTPSKLIEKGQLRKLVVGTFPYNQKGENGELVSEGMFTKKAEFVFPQTRPIAPDMEFVSRATPAVIKFSQPPRIMRNIRRVAILSDAQIGFLKDGEEYIPTHDPEAIKAAQGVVHDFAPHELGMIGDWGDVTMFSRWPKKPEYIGTANKSNQACHDILAEFISAAGPQLKRKMLVKGNHDDRYQIWARDTNLEAMGLRRATDTTGWSVLSAEYLWALDELGVEITEPYPQGIWWITDDLCAVHAPTKKLEMAASVIHGHLHKITRNTWAQTNSNGRVTYFQYDIGCLCKIDGSVPSDRARTDWAQGIALVEILDGKIPLHSVEQVHINNGRILWQGKPYGVAA